MLNHYIPENLLCTKCNEALIETDKGTFEREIWRVYVCEKCGEVYSNEPDYDSMPGGVDDY